MLFINSFDDCTSTTSNTIKNEPLLSSLTATAAVAAVRTLTSENYCVAPDMEHQRQQFNNTFFNTIIDAELAAAANSSFPPNLPFSTADNIGSSSINMLNSDLSSNLTLNSNIIYNKLTNESNSNANLHNFDMCYDTNNLSVIAASIAAASINQNAEFNPVIMQTNLHNNINDGISISSNLKAMPPTCILYYKFYNF